MSLVHLANACSHLQNASLARLGLTSLPRTNQLHALLLQMQKFGYVNNVTIGGPYPPPPSGISPVLSTNPLARRDVSTHVSPRMDRPPPPPPPPTPRTQPAAAAAEEEGKQGEEEEKQNEEEEEVEEEDEEDGEEAGVTQANIASRRLWIGLKYLNQRPVLEKMQVVSKPTRRVWMAVPQLEALIRGRQQGYVRGLRAVGEGMYLTTDRGIMEIREAVERRNGGMLLCRVNCA